MPVADHYTWKRRHALMISVDVRVTLKVLQCINLRAGLSIRVTDLIIGNDTKQIHL
jgi:hypothetical protein